MKKKMFVAVSLIVSAVAVVCGVRSVGLIRVNEVLFYENLDALASGEITVTTCLGLWNECTLADGTESKAPAVSLTKD